MHYNIINNRLVYENLGTHYKSHWKFNLNLQCRLHTHFRNNLCKVNLNRFQKGVLFLTGCARKSQVSPLRGETAPPLQVHPSISGRGGASRHCLTSVSATQSSQQWMVADLKRLPKCWLPSLLQCLCTALWNLLLSASLLILSRRKLTEEKLIMSPTRGQIHNNETD